MWIAMNDAFVSAVEDRNDPTRLVVRARNPEHLRRLFPSHDVVTTPSADYIARVFVSRDEFARLVADRIGKISYDNFKMSVDDQNLHGLYERMWSLHRSYQQKLAAPDRSRHMAWGPNDVVFHKRKD